MQAELERMIKYMDDRIIQVEREVMDLRALLEGKVLCDAEPVAWQVAVLLDDTLYRDTFDTISAAERYAMTNGGVVVPLYAPASLAGNADISPLGEAGKEGGA